MPANRTRKAVICFQGAGAWRGVQPGRFAYRLAGQTLASDVPLGLVSAFSLDAPEPLGQAAPAPGLEPDTPSLIAEGWLAGEARRVVCQPGPSGYEFLIPGVARFWVARSGDAIACREAEPAVAPALLEEALLGPPLTLALALRGVWCLHASALLGKGLILVLGASGQGKSTVAAQCHLAPGGLRRVADDILPCALVEGTPWARPHFPQLKLAAADQYPLFAPESLPLAALVVLAPSAATAAIALRPLPRVKAIKAIAEQTVAVRLFDTALRRAHLAGLAVLVRAVRCYRLQYPHDYGRLPEVYRAIAGL